MSKNKRKPIESIILVINPGSTSTKIALFHDEQKTASETITHSFKNTQNQRCLWDQFETRCRAIEKFISRQNADKFDAIVGRGGHLKPVPRGVYKVNETMTNDARNGVRGVHPSNMGPALAQKIAEDRQSTAYIVDPVSVNEFEPLARYSGHPLIERRSLSHALNIRAAAIWCAKKHKIDIAASQFIIGHLGGGISVAAVKGGRIIDVNDASSAGPFSPERSGSLPLQQFADLIYSDDFTQESIRKMIMGKGGLVAYLGTHDVQEVESRIAAGDKKAKEVFEAMIYQIAKEIAAMSAVLFGKVDGVVLTGGLAKSKSLVSILKKRISHIAPITVFEGELEMEAMAGGVLRVLRGEEKAKVY